MPSAGLRPGNHRAKAGWGAPGAGRGASGRLYPFAATAGGRGRVTENRPPRTGRVREVRSRGAADTRKTGGTARG